MKSKILLALLFLIAGPALAGPVDLGSNPAQGMANLSAGQELAANDPRVVQAQAWLKQAAKAAGEEEGFVANSCIKVARHIFDAAKVRALPLEVLEALAKFAPAGTPIGDTTRRYFEARRDSPNKSHGEAMAAMAKK